MVKCLPKFEYFTVFLKNRNFISKIRILEDTDYAALNDLKCQTVNIKIRPGILSCFFWIQSVC